MFENDRKNCESTSRQEDDLQIQGEANSYYFVMNENGKINKEELNRATQERLDEECNKCLNYDKEIYENTVEVNINW